MNDSTISFQDRPISEPIRLVIWDLDETFWRGTLTEGGISIEPDNVALVKTLAARGIMSSICSKNDFERVKDILAELDIWRYFVFPSISWEPKGFRVKKLIEEMQLRPASVLFVDDNHTNLAEVFDSVPGVNVRDETFIPDMLSSPLLLGKSDPSLSRLEQYKQMEARKSAQSDSQADANAFLRKSNISVEFVYDLKDHMERVVELINRTNQLNFTKVRLSENFEEAVRQLRPFIEEGFFQCALIRVSDTYGDHGFCGFYMVKVDTRDVWHFCFSCRILGLGVEQWVYEKLGRPSINIVGEVLSDLNEPRHVDWINVSSDASAGKGSRPTIRQAVTTRGGCELAAVVHYFASTSADAVGEYHFYRDGLPVRMDHSMIIGQAVAGLTPAQKEAAAKVGFLEQDFSTRIFDDFKDGHVVLLSFAVDVFTPMFRHSTSGFIAPVLLPHVEWEGNRGTIQGDLEPHYRAAIQKVADVVQSEFEWAGYIEEQAFKSNLLGALNKIPKSTDVFILSMFEAPVRINGVNHEPSERIIAINSWVREATFGRKNIHWLRMEDFAKPQDALTDHFHFHRLSYLRIFNSLQDTMSLLTTRRPTSPIRGWFDGAASLVDRLRRAS